MSVRVHVYVGVGVSFFQNKDLCFTSSECFVHKKILSVFCFQAENEGLGSLPVCNSGEALPGSWETYAGAQLSLEDWKPPPTQQHDFGSRPFLCGLLWIGPANAVSSQIKVWQERGFWSCTVTWAPKHETTQFITLQNHVFSTTWKSSTRDWGNPTEHTTLLAGRYFLS